MLPLFFSSIMFLGVKRSSLRSLRYIFLPVSIQQGTLAALIFSSSSLVVLSMYSIQPSSSISAVSMSSSVSSARRLHCLSRNPCLRCYLLPSVLRIFGDNLCLLCHFLRSLAPHPSSSFFLRCFSPLFSCGFALSVQRGEASCVVSF